MGNKKNHRLITNRMFKKIKLGLASIGYNGKSHWKHRIGYGLKSVTYYLCVGKEKFSIKKGLYELSHANLENEYIALKNIDNTVSPFPILFDKKNNVLVKTYISGHKITRLTRSDLKRFALMLRKIHKIKYDYFGKFNHPKKYLNGYSYYKRQINILKINIQKINNKNIVEYFNKLLSKYLTIKPKSSFRKVEYTVINFDILPANVIQKKNMELAIIDWGDASIGDPALEISRVFIFWKFNNKQREYFWKHYKNDSSAIRARTDIYEPLIRINNLVWEVQMYHRLLDRKNMHNPRLNAKIFAKLIKVHFSFFGRFNRLYEQYKKCNFLLKKT